MITVITAVPGSGKTLYVVEQLDKEVRKIVDERKNPDPDPVILNRRIYHNIDGLDVTRFADPSLLLPLPEDADWRQTPDGSLVVYDEAWQFFPVTSKRDVDDPRLADLAVHRHTGHDIIFITQHPSQLHTFLRRLGNIHIHLYRMFGLAVSTVYTWQHVVDSPNSRTEQERADKQTWKFPKRYYSWYKSATAHTHKFRLPRRITFYLLLAVGILGYFGQQLYQDKNSIIFAALHDPPKAEAQGEAAAGSVAPATAPQPATPEASPEAPPQPEETIPDDSPYLWTLNKQTTPIQGCAVNKKRGLCVCYGQDGAALHMSHAACLSVISKPLPRSIIRR